MDSTPRQCSCQPPAGRLSFALPLQRRRSRRPPAPCSPVGMVDVVDPNVFETANAGFAQVMYEEFLRDPAAVGPEWRRLFESGIVGERPDGNGAAAPRPAVAAALAPATPSAPPAPAPAPTSAPTPLPPGASAIKGPAAK